MGRSITEVVQERLDPTSVSNALYEVMVDWYRIQLRINHGDDGMYRLEQRREMLELVLSRFLDADLNEVQQLLSDHFKVKR